MKKTTIIEKVLKMALEAVDMEEVSDYKDMNKAISDNIGELLVGRPRIAALFDDMPDGFQCPRGFGEWLAKLHSL